MGVPAPEFVAVALVPRERVAELLTVPTLLCVKTEGVAWGVSVAGAFVEVGRNPDGVGARRLREGPSEGEG